MVDPVRVVEPVALRVLGQQRFIGAAQELHVLAVDAARQERVHDLHLRHQVARRERRAALVLRARRVQSATKAMGDSLIL